MESKICKTCNNELILDFSQALGICSHCREMKYPKHLHPTQWDTYWRLYLEKENER